MQIRLTVNISKPAIIDQPEVVTPNNDGNAIQKMKGLPHDVSQMRWPQSTKRNTYGVTMSGWLGFAMPNLAQNNADNYAAFVLCLRYPTLDCVGTFAISVSKRESVPFTVPLKVSQKLRNHGMSSTRKMMM